MYFYSHLLIISNINIFYNFDSLKYLMKGSAGPLQPVKSISNNNNNLLFSTIAEPLWNIHYMLF